jgi:arylsulfatase
MSTPLRLAFVVFAASGIAGPDPAHAGRAAPARPNFLVVLADDLGFSDIGGYGSEIETPILDRLASNGLRFTQFYNTAKCHSSRVSLLSGRWCRQAGDESLRRAVILPEVLQPAGYFTAMAGKWHLSKDPTDFGFQRAFGHLSGACNYYLGDRTFRLNGEPWAVPATNFYTTVANVDHALRFLGEAREAKKPWFLYLAFNAPHAPLQPLEADYKHYLGRYDAGWDAVRAARAAKQRDLGLFGKDLEPCPRPAHIPAWESLSPEMRTREARRMAAYAGLIHRIDAELGRLVADLRQAGELDNTLILFLSDNGACPYDRRSQGRDREPYEPDTRWSDSTGWAWARNTPFRYYKQNQFEGGITTPAIIHWPAGLKAKPGTLVHSPVHLVDVLPTLAELAGARIPDTWPGREPTPLAGVSLAPILGGGEVTNRPPIHLLFASDRGLRDGDWKLVSFQSQPWELYDVARDRTELHDVAAQHPDVVARMAKQWHDMAMNVLQAPAKECAPVAAAATGQRHREWTDFSTPDASDTRHATAKEGRAGRKERRGKPAESATPALPRARVGTKLEVKDGRMILQCSGDDPGLAFDRLDLPDAKGPFRLEFRLQSRAEGKGEIYWTDDAATKLPAGKRLEFDVKHDGAWQDVSLEIPATAPPHALRLDPCAGAGEVEMEALRIKDAAGRTLAEWP